MCTARDTEVALPRFYKNMRKMVHSVHPELQNLQYNYKHGLQDHSDHPLVNHYCFTAILCLHRFSLIKGKNNFLQTDNV